MTERRFSNRTVQAFTTVVLTSAAAGFLAGCGTETEAEEQQVYCADEQGRVVDEDYCDDGYRGGGSYFFFVGSFGGNSYRAGDRIPGRYLSGGVTRISPGDTAARQRAGLPGSGKVTGGTRVSGGIGSGTGGAGNGSTGRGSSGGGSAGG